MAEHKVIIEEIGALGDGIAKIDDKEIYVPYTIKGEEVSLNLDNGKIKSQSIIKKSPNRTAPVCPHFLFCGGCAMQHIKTEAYQNWKSETFKNTLKEYSDKIAEPIFIDNKTRRRVSFGFRINENNPNKSKLGFNAKSKGKLIDISVCYLLDSKLESLITTLRDLLPLISPPKENIKKPNRGKNRRNKKPIEQIGDIFVTHCENGFDLTIIAKWDADMNIRQDLFEFVRNNPDIIRISWANKHYDTPENIIEVEKPFIKVNEVNIELPPMSFLQPSIKGQEALINLVNNAIKENDESDIKNIADLFCGIGTFTFPVVTNLSKNVTAIDVNASQVKSLQNSLHKNELSKITSIERNLFALPLMAKELEKYEVVIFDPPRAGAINQVQEFANASNKTALPKLVIAVSCNPATFARDAKILIETGYELQKINMVDQFIYSHHSELVAVFTKKQTRKKAEIKL